MALKHACAAVGLRGAACGRRVLVALLLSAASTMAAAQAAQKAGDAEPARQDAPADGIGHALEATRSAVRSTTEWLARGVDSWFGDKPFEKGGSVTDGRLSLGTLERHGDRTDVRLRFNARLRLPNVSERGYAFVGRDNEREVVSDTPGSVTRRERLQVETADQQSFFAGVGVPLRDAVDLRVGLRGGLKPYVQARYRQPFAPTEIDLLDFRQTFFWTVDDQLGSTTALSYEHAFTPTVAARWLGAATITRVSGQFEWSNVAGGYWSLGRQRVLGLEAVVSGEQGTGVGVSEYGMRARWEQPIYRDWLIAELLLGHFWSQEDAASDRERIWAFGLSVLIKF